MVVGNTLYFLSVTFGGGPNSPRRVLYPSTASTYGWPCAEGGIQDAFVSRFRHISATSKTSLPADEYAAVAAANVDLELSQRHVQKSAVAEVNASLNEYDQIRQYGKWPIKNKNDWLARFVWVTFLDMEQYSVP